MYTPMREVVAVKGIAKSVGRDGCFNERGVEGGKVNTGIEVEGMRWQQPRGPYLDAYTYLACSGNSAHKAVFPSQQTSTCE